MLYVGGGCLDSSKELREFVAKTGIPVASTLMGLGAFPDSDALALQVCPCCPLCLSLDRQVLLCFGRVPLWVQAPGQCQAVTLLQAVLPYLCRITAKPSMQQLVACNNTHVLHTA